MYDYYHAKFQVLRASIYWVIKQLIQFWNWNPPEILESNQNPTRIQLESTWNSGIWLESDQNFHNRWGSVNYSNAQVLKILLITASNNAGKSLSGNIICTMACKGHLHQSPPGGVAVWDATIDLYTSAMIFI